jgi:UDP-sugar transporter A1/2/3
MTGKSSSSSSGTAAGNRLALIYCVALALQFGFQPILQARFIPRGASKTSIVIATEMSKILISIISIGGEGPKAIRSIISEWSIVDSCKIALVPATLYAIQNLLVQYAYTVLDSMTFSLLNQTKVSLNSSRFWFNRMYAYMYFSVCLSW